MVAKRRVLILCTGNSCRSQMAEALWRHLAAGRWEAHSAGSRPSGFVHPLAIRAMAELGVDIGNHTSKPLTQFAGQRFDLVITVCSAAAEACPTFPGAGQVIHWPLDDPAAVTGSEEEQMPVFRHVRDELQARITAWLAAEPQ